MNSRDLHYYVTSSKSDFNLNIFDAEIYSNALVVQSLIGNLVYYSNLGQYELRLAKSFRQINSHEWEFTLRDKLVCENKELITAESYAESLKRVMKKLSKGSIPVLENLQGYKEFTTHKKELKGLVAEGNLLRFKFDKPIKSGLLQVLSFSPFGYICKENFNTDGTWKSNSHFISSGPYQIDKFETSDAIVLKRNPNWEQDYNENAPNKVNFFINREYTKKTDGHAVIIDSGKGLSPHVKKLLRQYKLVPEYITTILLGKLNKGFFKNLNARRFFRKEINTEKKKIGFPVSNFVFSDTFYPHQKKIVSDNKPDSFAKDFKQYIKQNSHLLPLIIQGIEPLDPNTYTYYSWRVLKSILQKWELPYRFVGGQNYIESNAPSFDFRLRTTAIGGGLEIWGAHIVFCSKLGVQFPDPTGDICELIKAYNEGEVEFTDVKKSFFEKVEEDSAILPLAHSGNELYISDQINTESISPALNIIKFDQLSLN